MSWHWSDLLRWGVHSSCLSEQFTPKCSSRLTVLLPVTPAVLSPWLLRYLSLIMINETTQNFSFPSIKETQMFLILSLLMQSFWHTGDKWGAFVHSVKMNTLIWMHSIYFCFIYMSFHLWIFMFCFWNYLVLS